MTAPSISSSLLLFLLLLSNLSFSHSHEKRAIVHVGPHKTGSSYIQNMLILNAKLLESHGYKVLEKQNAKKLSKLAFALKGQANQSAAMYRPEKRVVDLYYLKSISDFIQEERKSIVISSEEMDDLDFAAAAELRSLLRDFHVTIVFFHRERTELLRSNYFQRTRYERRCPPPFDVFVQENRAMNFSSIPGVELNHTLSVFATVFGSDSMRVISYDGVLQRRMDIFDVFLRDILRIDSTKNVLHVRTRVNESPSTEMLDLKSAKCSSLNLSLLPSSEHDHFGMKCKEMRELGNYFQESDEKIFHSLNIKMLYPTKNVTFAKVCHVVHSSTPLQSKVSHSEDNSDTIPLPILRRGTEKEDTRRRPTSIKPEMMKLRNDKLSKYLKQDAGVPWRDTHQRNLKLRNDMYVEQQRKQKIQMMRKHRGLG